MARKYRSMQEELEARKKAGVYGDLSQFEKRMFHNEPEWVKKSREDAERSKKISQAQQPLTGYLTDLLDRDTAYSEQPGERAADRYADVKKTGKWSLRGKKNAEKRALRQTEKTEKTIELQNIRRVFEQIKETAAEQAAQSAGRKPQKKRSGCVIPIVILLILLPVIGAVYEAVLDLSNDFFDENYSYEYFDSYEETGELSVNSFYTEAEAFIMDNYIGSEADSEDLYFWFFDSGAYTLLDEQNSVNVAVSPEDGSCYLMFWAECSEDENPNDVITYWMSFTEDMWEILDGAGYTDVPVCIILKENEAWELRLVMIDNEILFTAGGF